jgi:hypothetical protein
LCNLDAKSGGKSRLGLRLRLLYLRASGEEDMRNVAAVAAMILLEIMFTAVR